MKIYVINENTCTRVKLYGMDVINTYPDTKIVASSKTFVILVVS